MVFSSDCFNLSSREVKNVLRNRGTKSVLDRKMGRKVYFGREETMFDFLKGNGDKISLNRCRLGSDITVLMVRTTISLMVMVL